MDDNTIQQLADEAVARCMADFEAEREAAKRAALPTPEQQLAEAKLRELLTEQALLHDGRASAIRHIVRDGVEVFTITDDNELIHRNNATDPNDPLSPLTPSRWLQELAKTEPNLFTTPGKAH